MTGAQPGAPARLIVALGDSTTAGTPGCRSPVETPPDGEGNAHSQFAYWMMRARPAWTVLNRGVNGERTDEIAARFDRDVLPHKPDVLVLLAGVNDVYQGLTVENVQANLLSMYTRARDAGLRVVAASILPYNTATPEQNSRMARINAWIRDVAEHMDTMTFCDTRAAVADSADIDRLRDSPDDLHPSVDGYRRMADVLVPAVDWLLR